MNLESLQREMAAAVMQPLTADEQMQAHSSDGRTMQAVAESFIAPNSRLSAFERLEIYNRQYWFRVLSALAEDFPALSTVIGSGAFDRLSIAYLTAYPSRSFSLRNLGSHLPEWLSVNPQYAGRRHRLAVDVARIEWAFVQAFDSAEHAPLTLDQIATLEANSRLALQPHVQLIALDYPADDLVLNLHKRDKRQTSEAGVRHEDSRERPARISRVRRRATWAAAHRVDLAVYYRRLQREEFVTLMAIARGMPLAEAIAAGFADSRIPESRRAGNIRQWFATWAELGWICAPDLESLL
jgi:Putative DNA-binding domain